MNDPAPTAAAPTRPTGPSSLRRALVRISSPWVSLSLLTVAFVHQAVGSAFYTFRQSFEVNEMEWFNGPLSLALWVTICCCLITASMVRIPWRWSRGGAHLTHVGVVLLVITCAIYFAWKEEGEALLLRRYVRVDSELGACRLLPNPGYAQLMGDATAKVQAIMPRWTILSPAGKSEQAWAIMVEVRFPDGTPFTATLIEDRPDLTQYTVEGRQPASYLPEFTGVVAEKTADGEQVRALDADGKNALPTKLTIGAKTAETVAGGQRSLEITGITPDFQLLADGFQGKRGTLVQWTLKGVGGQESGSSIVGEPSLTRFQRARLKQVPDARLKAIALEPAPWALAYHKDRAALWVRRESALHQDPLQPMRAMDASVVVPLAIPGLPRYFDHGSHISGIPAHGMPARLGRTLLGGDGADPTPLDIPIGRVDGVDFTVTGFAPYARLVSEWREDPTAQPDPMLDLAITRVATGEVIPKQVRATTDAKVLEQVPITWVHCIDDPAYNAAIASLQKQFPVLEKENEETPDEALAARTRIAFLSAPGHAMAVWLGQPGRNLVHFDVAAGKEVTASLWGDDLRIKLRSVLQRPSKSTQPVPVADDQRMSRSQVGDFESWIEVTAHREEERSTSIWLPYTPHPHLPHSLGEGDGPLMMYQPRPGVITVSGVRFELAYGKEPLPLPGPMWMTGFDVPRRPGSSSPSEFFCHVGFGDAKAPGTAVIHMNHPLEWQDTFFFQANWDPSFQAITVLGVGNRPAGGWMLAAAIVLALGMAWSGLSAALRGRRAE